jgi:hypothetical protein
MRKSRRKIFYIIISLLYFITASCHIDTGLEPTKSGFKGTVHFKDKWPENTDQVIVVASTKFPPTVITEIVLGEPLPLFQDSVQYEIYTPPEKFAAVGVVWKEKDQPWDVTNIIGIYFDSPNHFVPGSIDIKNREEMIDSVNITAELSKAKRKVDSRVQGRIIVKGQWPPLAESVLVAASHTILPSSLLDISFGFPIAAPFDTTDYSLPIQPGSYALIGALVIETGASIGFESIKGIYKKKPTDFLPGTVKIGTDTTIVKNIDILIDFDNPPFGLGAAEIVTDHGVFE